MWGESVCHMWISLTRGQECGVLMFSQHESQPFVDHKIETSLTRIAMTLVWLCCNMISVLWYMALWRFEISLWMLSMTIAAPTCQGNKYRYFAANSLPIPINASFDTPVWGLIQSLSCFLHLSKVEYLSFGREKAARSSGYDVITTQRCLQCGPVAISRQLVQTKCSRYQMLIKYVRKLDVWIYMIIILGVQHTVL